VLKLLCAIGQKLSITLKSENLAVLAFIKNSRHTHPKLAEVEPSFRKVSLLPAKLHMLFPTHLWVRVLATNLLPLTGPGLRPTVQNSSQHENGQGLECRKVNFLEYLGQGTNGCHSLSKS